MFVFLGAYNFVLLMCSKFAINNCSMKYTNIIIVYIPRV